MDANKSCTANFTPTAIAAPATPTVTANTVGVTTTYSWGAASCPGNTARYQYRYTISPSGYDSGLVATSSTSIDFTTSTEGQTYTVAVQAECYNTVTASGMSGAGSGTYHRSITSWLKISAGRTHTCAIASNNNGYCWGSNTYGGLGNGTNNDSNVPVPVYTGGVLSGLTLKDIKAGNLMTCAIASNDNAYCWGYNYQGNLGANYNSPTSSNVPVAVYTAGALSGKTIKSIATSSSYGFQSCAIASDNKAYCWGANGSGELGDNTIVNKYAPVAVNTSVMSGTVTAITVGDSHTCAISNGIDYCWGLNDPNSNQTYGYVGVNTTADHYTTPIAVYTGGVMNGQTIIAVSAGKQQTCAASSTAAYCWGLDWDGELGNNAVTNTIAPVAVYASGVLSGKTITTITSGAGHSCVIANGNAYCWGWATDGELGTNSVMGISCNPTYPYSTYGWSCSSVPVAVDTTGVLSGKTITAITAGTSHTCTIASNSMIYCWGGNGSGQLGDGTNSQKNTPVAIVSP
jgi:alpha-tubulin suppressor-like RCC1 family protein